MDPGLSTIEQVHWWRARGPMCCTTGPQVMLCTSGCTICLALFHFPVYILLITSSCIGLIPSESVNKEAEPLVVSLKRVTWFGDLR